MEYNITGIQSNIIINSGKSQIFSDDPDISGDAISTIVTLRENGIAECTLIANNYEGKLYLSTLKPYDEVVVRFTYSDDELNDAQWEDIQPVFTGNIIELNNSLVKEGETLSIIAMGKGYCTKLMRVADEYGLQSKSTRQKTLRTIVDKITDAQNETRYMRNDEVLGLNQTLAYDSINVGSTVMLTDLTYFGIRVWIVHSNTSTEEVTSGTAVAIASHDASNSA